MYFDTFPSTQLYNKEPLEEVIISYLTLIFDDIDSTKDCNSLIISELCIRRIK